MLFRSQEERCLHPALPQQQPLQDGDIIDVKNSEKQFGMKIIGKDDEGKNIVVADIDKEYDVITQYDLVYRDYNKSKTLLSDCEVY